MDSAVDGLEVAYSEFVAAAAAVMEAREGGGGGLDSPATDAALEALKQRWEVFRVTCDQAEELIESMKQRIGSECLVDEATGGAPAQPPSGIPPISAVRLEQMSKAVRWLVLDLQQGAGAAPAPPLPPHLHSSAFAEDPAQ